MSRKSRREKKVPKRINTAGRLRFERLLEEALAELPRWAKEAVRNLAIVVEDEPDQSLLRDIEKNDQGALLGLYVGVPLPARTFAEEPVLPDQIFIFRGPLERMCRNPKELREQIKITLVHELAHFFGFDEDYLEQLGLD